MARKQAAQRDFINTLKENVIETINLDKCFYNKANMLHAYWGVEPADNPTIECLVPILKLRDCINLKIKTTILIADVHAELNLIEQTTADAESKQLHINSTNDKAIFYEFLFKLILSQLKMNDCVIKRGSDIQLNRGYVLDLFRLMKETKIDDAKNIGRGIVSAAHDNKVSSLVYPLMQIVDEAALDANIQIGSITQKAIYEYANTIATKPRTYLMHEHIACNITFTDHDDLIKYKCNEMTDETCLSIIKHIVLPIYGKFNSYTNYNDIVAMLLDKDISMTDIRFYLALDLIRIIKPIREYDDKNKVI